MNILEVIKFRRSIPTNKMIDKTITTDIIQKILECAIHAPNHKLTQPWRFVVFQGEGRQILSDFMVEDYNTNTPDDMKSDVKLEKVKKNPLNANIVIAIILHKSPEGTLPEWEEIASIGCAVQNMWIYSTSIGIGCYWSTPGIINRMNSFLKLTENEKCLGLFYLGYHELPLWEGKRSTIDEKVTWVKG
jgi:nitroreductase